MLALPWERAGARFPLTIALRRGPGTEPACNLMW